jgi:hypothetical protein
MLELAWGGVVVAVEVVEQRHSQVGTASAVALDNFSG